MLKILDNIRRQTFIGLTIISLVVLSGCKDEITEEPRPSIGDICTYVNVECVSSSEGVIFKDLFEGITHRGSEIEIDGESGEIVLQISGFIDFPHSIFYNCAEPANHTAYFGTIFTAEQESLNDYKDSKFTSEYLHMKANITECSKNGKRAYLLKMTFEKLPDDNERFAYYHIGGPPASYMADIQVRRNRETNEDAN